MDWRPYFLSDSVVGTAGTDAITVPTNRILHITGIRATLTASNTVGNRFVVVRVSDSDSNILMETRGGAVTAASQIRYYHFSTGFSDLTSFVDTDYICNSLADLWLPAGLLVSVIDRAGIDPTSDAMEIAVFGEIADYLA